MAFKPNHQQQRAERNRAKELKKQEKLQSRNEDAARHRAATGPEKTEDSPAEQRTPSVEGGDDGQS